MLAEAFSEARLDLSTLDKDIKVATAKVKAAAEQIEASLQATLDIDTTAAERKLDQFAANAARMKARIESNAVTIQAEVDLDPERAAALGREARQALDTGFGNAPLDLDFDVDFEAAAFAGRVARESIQEGFGDPTLIADVTADFDAALFAGRVARESLDAGFGDAPVGVGVRVDLSAIAEARAEIEALTRFNEDVRLDLNTKQFDASYAKVVAKLEALTRKQWSVDLDSNADVIIDLIEEVIAAAQEADRLKVGINFDTDGADAARRAAEEARDRIEADPPTIRPTIDMPEAITPEVDTDRIDRGLASLRGELDDLVGRTNRLTFSADGEDAIAEASRIRNRLASLLDLIAQITVNTDLQGDEQVLARLAEIDAAARRIDAVAARLSVSATGSEETITELFAVGRVADSLDTDIEYKVGVQGRLGDVIRTANERIAAAAGRVQVDLNEQTNRQVTRDDLAAARAQADNAFKEAVKAERLIAAEVLKARRKTARKGLDLAARDDLKEAKQRLAAAREATGKARDEATARLRAFREADNDLAESRRRTKLDDVIRRITVRTEGFAKAQAEIALLKRAEAGLDSSATFTVNSDGIVDAIARTETLRDRSSAAFRDIGDKAAEGARRAREAFDGRGQGNSGFDFSDAAENAQRYFRSIPLLASTAAQRARDSFDGRGQSGAGFDFSEAAESAQRYFRTLPVIAATAAQRVRTSFDGRGQGGFDFSEASASALRYFRTLPLLAATATTRLRKSLSEGGTIRLRVTGTARAIADLAKVVAAKVVAAKDVTIGVNVRGGVSRVATRAAAAAGGLLASAAQSAGRIAVQGLEQIGQLGSTIAGAFGQASSAVSDFAATASKQLSSLASTLSAASGPIGAVASAAASLALPAAIIAGITVLAGPIIAAIGGLIGAAIAFLASSAVAGLAAVGLPIAAILFNDDAKDQLLKQIKPLKDLLLTEFGDITQTIVNEVAPAFVALGAKVIPLAASVSESFILPISTSILNLLDSLLPVIQQVTGPMAEGIASVLDTFTKFAPLFGNITLAVGPGLTNAFNAILDVSLTIASIFADDIGAGFQGFADLLNRLEPALTAAGSAVLPIVNFVGELIALFVESGAIFEGTYGPIGDVFDRLTASLPQLAPIFAQIAALIVGLVESFVELLPVISLIVRAGLAVYAVFQGITGLLAKLIGYAIKGLGNVLDLALSGLAGITGFINDLPGVGRLIDDGAQAEIQAYADGISDAVTNADELGNGLLRSSGAVIQAGLGLGDLTNTTTDAAAAIAQLNGQLQRGEISLAEYGDATGRAVPETLNSLTGFIDDLVTKLEEGEFAIGKFVDTVQRELPTAADFVEEIEIKSPVAQFREDRDRQREMENLNRQAQRDADQIGRNAEDYQQAIEDAAKLRQEAPKLYTFGAKNFNAALFADSVERQQEYEKQTKDAERNIQDRARALEDARIQARDSQSALEDARYDALFGEPETIKAQAIDIRNALAQASQQVADAQQKALTLIQIRNLGRDFDPLADFLEKLDPAVFVASIGQLGPVGSEAFAAVAAQWNAEIDKGNTTFEESLRATRDIIAEERLRIERLNALYAAGATDLIDSLLSIESAEEFNNIYEGIEAGTGLAAANAAAAAVAGERDELLRFAEQSRYDLTTAYIEAGQKGVTRAQADAAAKAANGATSTGIAGLGSLAAALEGQTGGDVNGATSTALAGLGAVATALEGKAAEVSTIIVDAVTAAAEDIPDTPFYTAGADAALAFSREFSVQVGTGEGFTGALLAGNKLAGALAIGILAGPTEGLTVPLALSILAGTAVDTVVAAEWNATGVSLGQELTGGIRDGIEVTREFLTGKLNAVRLGVALQGGPFAAAGATLGVATILGVIAAIQERIPLFVLVLGTVALSGLGTIGQWAVTGAALANALVAALVAVLAASAARVAAGIQQLVSTLNLDLLVLSGVNVGSALVAGIVQGMLNGRAEIENAARIIARAAADAAAKELEINSPSRVFMRLGESTAEGFAMGVQSGNTKIGTGVGAALTGQVQQAGNNAVFNQQRTTTDQSVTESNVFYVSNPDPYATAAEIAQQQRSRRYLNSGKRR